MWNDKGYAQKRQNAEHKGVSTSRARFLTPTTRQDILWAARKLFAERGYDQTRIADIAAHVDIRPPTVLFYFETKAKLFTITVRAQIKATRTQFVHTKRVGGTTPLQQICDVVYDHVTGFARFNPDQRRLLACVIQQSARFPMLADDVLSVQKDMADILLPMVTAGQKAHLLKHQDPPQTIMSFRAYLHGLGTMAETLMSPDLADTFWAEMISRGVWLFAPTVSFDEYLKARIEAEK